MPKTDYIQANEYALKRLERELPPNLVYHSLEHTRDEVVPMVKRLAEMEGVESEDILLLETAAYFHDVGFVEQRDGHELNSIRIAKAVLPGFGFTTRQIKTITDIIMATRIPQNPHTLLEEIIDDADLDSLGRTDYWERAQILRAELIAYGAHITDTEWCKLQKKLLHEHQYFTASARLLRDAQKQKNIVALLERCKPYLDDADP